LKGDSNGEEVRMNDPKQPADPDEEKLNGRSGGGDSGGGAYPDPRRGKGGKKDGFMGSGGQSEMPYHGTGRLGGEDAGGNPNSPAKG
jgi:hypothetical protein